MKFESSFPSKILVNQVQNNLKTNFYISLVYMLGGSLFLYKLYPHFDIVLIIGEAIMICLLLLIDGMRTIPTGKIINKTASEIVFLENSIRIKTMPIRVFFWLNRPPIEIDFKIGNFKTSQLPYPIKMIYDLDNKVWVFSALMQEIYIISDFFEEGFEEQIKRIVYKI